MLHSHTFSKNFCAQTTDSSFTTDSSVIELELDMQKDDIVVFPWNDRVMGGSILDISAERFFIQIAIRGGRTDNNLNDYSGGTATFKGEAEYGKVKLATINRVRAIGASGQRTVFGDPSTRFNDKMFLMKLRDCSPYTNFGEIEIGTAIAYNLSPTSRQQGIVLGISLDTIDDRITLIVVHQATNEVVQVPLVKSSAVEIQELRASVEEVSLTHIN
jgi:hypothetical protein